MSKKIRAAFIAACLISLFGITNTIRAQIPSVAKNSGADLIGMLTNGLSITPEQATGGAGAIFNQAKSVLKPKDFAKISKVVPGMDGLLGAAPKAVTGNSEMISSVAGALPGGLGGIATLASQFQTLGLSPDVMAKFVPIMSKYLQTTGGSGVAKIFGGALK